MRFIYSIVFVFASCALTWAQFENDVLNRHNFYRDKHGVPRLTLDNEISSWAQDWANNLAANNKFEHRPNNKYGENLYATTGTPTGNEAIDAFYNEIKDYDFNNPGFSMSTGHFTQVVWKNSKKIGVGKAKGSGGWTYVVVNYDPPGNYIGEFAENVPRPL